jgi:hypothetical protein
VKRQKLALGEAEAFAQLGRDLEANDERVARFAPDAFDPQPVGSAGRRDINGI